MSFDLVGCQQVNHCRCEITMYLWKIEGKALTSRIKSRLDVAFGIQYALAHEGCTDGLGCLQANGQLFAVYHVCQFRQCRNWHLAKGDATVFLVLSLEGASEVLIAFVGHYEQ